MTTHAQQIHTLLETIGQVMLGKQAQIKLALCCLLAKGHLLIEDIPGVGKTTLARTLAAVLGIDLQRIQFTSDLLPADLIGVSIFEQQTQSFRFHAGPIFTGFLLADELNRATPKTQSALLEAMQEGQVTCDGITHALSDPFFVIATENPNQQIGTFPLPESQLDRFLMRISLGYPDAASERVLLQHGSTTDKVKQLSPQLGLTELLDLQKAVALVHVSDTLLDYVQSLIKQTRTCDLFINGLSTRGALALIAASRAYAMIENRDHVLPEDVQAVVPSVLGHRLTPNTQATDSAEYAITTLLEQVAVPI